jgi:hypothetical protein
MRANGPLSQVMHVPTWVPGAGFKRKAASWKRQAEAMIDTLFAHAKALIVSTVSSLLVLLR